MTRTTHEARIAALEEKVAAWSPPWTGSPIWSARSWTCKNARTSAYAGRTPGPRVDPVTTGRRTTGEWALR
jgi:hypothetical protein